MYGPFLSISRSVGTNGDCADLAVLPSLFSRTKRQQMRPPTAITTAASTPRTFDCNAMSEGMVEARRKEAPNEANEPNIVKRAAVEKSLERCS